MAEKRRPLPRYSNEILAWEYDQRQPSPLPGELEWYLEYANRSESPILELACGSGRLLLPMAQAGYEIHGVDSSEAMLKRLREKLGVLNIGIQQKIKMFCSDIMEFNPSQKYNMVFNAYNSLRELETKDRIQSCFQRVFHLLVENGYFLFVVRRISPKEFQKGRRVVFDSLNKPFLEEEKGFSVSCKITAFPDSQNRIVNENTYIIKQRGRRSETIDFVTYTPIMDTPEYLKMLKDIGFTVKVYSGYNEQSEDGVSKEICFVCRKSA